MRKEGWIEIHSQPVAFRPFDPALEVFWPKRIAVHALAIRFGIRGVQIEPMLPRYQRKGLLHIRSQFISRPRFPRIISRDGQASPQTFTRFFKAAHVISLPT